MNRAYSILEIKQVKEDGRLIEGIASTPKTDRVGDIVESMGAQFTLPMPLLLDHNSREQVGHVEFAQPTKKGIPFRARIKTIDEPGDAKALVDKAWHFVKHGLRQFVSIGFRALENGTEVLKSGGLRFTSWEWLELSLVSIPAQPDAVISQLKSLDADLLAATGHDKQNGSERTEPAGASATRSTKVVKAQEGKAMKKTIAEQISAFENTRQAKAARMDDIMDVSAEKGETLDDAGKEEYDTLDSEVKEIDEHLVRLRAREKTNITKAVPVDGKDMQSATESRAGISVISVRPNVPPGTAFIRKFLSIYNGKNHGIHPADYFKAQPHWQNTPEVEMVLRAPVAAGTTLGTTWAAPLVVAENMAAEFAELLRPLTIIGRIPGLSRVPFNIKIPRETTGATVGWVGEGAVKPVSAMAFDQITLLFNKVAGIVPITEELLKFSSPAAEGIIRDSLTKGIAQLTDRDFLDPTKSAVAGVSPASVTNGVTPITASGTTADALRADLGALLAAYTTGNANLSGLVLVMTSTQAMRIAMMRNTLGQRDFEGLGRDGGTLETIPVIVSENIVATGGSPADGYLIVAINAPEILLADDGAVEIDVSREASLQMNTAPDSPETTSTILVSLWQRNMVGIKAERFITWAKRRSDAVQFIQNAKYT